MSIANNEAVIQSHTLSARSNASSWSWVTMMVVTPTLRTISFSPARSVFRTTASRAPKGSSSSRSLGVCVCVYVEVFVCVSAKCDV